MQVIMLADRFISELENGNQLIKVFLATAHKTISDNCTKYEFYDGSVIIEKTKGQSNFNYPSFLCWRNSPRKRPKRL